MRTRAAILAVSLFALRAGASNLTVDHSGYVLGANDQPVNATVPASFSIYAASAPGEAALWTGTYTVDVKSGYYAAALGAPGTAPQPLSSSVFDNPPVWLEVTLGGVVLSPRVRLDPAPSAAVARDVNCSGCVSASELDFDPLADGAVTTGKLANAAVTDAKIAGVAASKISGLISSAQIEGLATSKLVGTVVDTQIQSVSASKVTGVLDPAQIPGGGSGSLAGISISATAPTSPANGTLYFDTTLNLLRLRNGTSWTNLSTGTPGCGATSAEPGVSCKEIFTRCGATTSTTYWVKGSGTTPINVYCDMSPSDGGWTLVMKLSAGDFCYGSSRWTDGTAYNAASTLTSLLPNVGASDAKSQAFSALADVTTLRLETQGGRISIPFASASSPQTLMTTNSVAFASYPDFTAWRSLFSSDRTSSPFMMRAGVAIGPGARSMIGCGQPCVFCMQVADAGADISSGIGNNTAYCGGGNTTRCSTGGQWSNNDNRTIVWAR